MSRPGDTQFFSGDPEEVITQHLHVVEADRGKDCNIRIPGIGSIVAAAQAHFKDAELQVFPSEGVCGQSRNCFEHAECPAAFGFEVSAPFVEVGHTFGPGVLAEDMSLDLDAFSECMEVGRGIEPDAPAGGLQHGGQ